MIRTESEYRRSLEQLRNDAAYMQSQRAQMEQAGLSGEQLERAMQPALSFHEQLREEIETYEQMRRGELPALYSFSDIGVWLIGVRIAQNLTQRELAERLGISEAQVSRDERNEYHGISVDRAQHILQTMGVQFRIEGEKISVDSPTIIPTTKPKVARAEALPSPKSTIPPTASTPAHIAAFLRADKNLEPEKAENLAEMMRLAYEAATGKRR